MHSPADEDLMLQVRNGNVARLGELFERYQTPLFQFNLRMTGHRQLSEDLVQEVFLRVLRFRHTYQPGTPFNAWVYRIARNVRTDSVRRRRPETQSDVAFAMAKDKEPLPDKQHQTRQEEDLLREALARLDEDKREVLLLSRFHGMKYEQIAELLDCQVSTIKARVFRAVRDLREQYAALAAPSQSQTRSDLV